MLQCAFSVLQCVIVRCKTLQCGAICYCVLQCVAACCSVLQCLAVLGSVLQRLALCVTKHKGYLLCGSGVATISKLLKIIGLFCKRALSKRRYSTKKTFTFNEPTNHSHPTRCGFVVCDRYASG